MSVPVEDVRAELLMTAPARNAEEIVTSSGRDGGARTVIVERKRNAARRQTFQRRTSSRQPNPPSVMRGQAVDLLDVKNRVALRKGISHSAEKRSRSWYSAVAARDRVPRYDHLALLRRCSNGMAG